MSNSPFDSTQERSLVGDLLRGFRPEYPYLTPSLDDCLQQSQDEQSRQARFAGLLAQQTNRTHESTPVAGSGAEPAGIRRVLPDVLCCIDCRAQFAFASQIIQNPFHDGGEGSYVVAPPPHNIGHTYGPVFDPEPVGNEDDNDDDEVKRSFDPDAAHYLNNAEYMIRRRRDNLHNVVLSSPSCANAGRSKVIICSALCAKCGSDLGFKYIDTEDPQLMHRIGMFHLISTRLFTQHSYASVSDATVARMDQNLMRGLNQEESTLRYLDNTHGAQVSGFSTPLPPDVATWKSRSGGTFSQAEADPHGAVRSLQAQRNHRLSVVGHATRYRQAKVARLRQRNQGMKDSSTPVQKIAPTRPVRWDPNKDDAAHIPARCFSSEDLKEVRTPRARYFDRAENIMFESVQMGDLDDFQLSPRDQDSLRTRLEARRKDPLHRDTWALRERRCAIAPQTIEFDLDDEDECEALFSGKWCSREVAVQRAKKEQDKRAKLKRARQG